MAKRQAFISEAGEVVYAEVGLNYIELYDADFAHLGIVWLYEMADIKRAEKISSYEELMKFFTTAKTKEKVYEEKRKNT
jgi:hypothetical protein